MSPSLRESGRAEGRLKESLWLRCNGLPLHDYPGRQDDLRTIRAYHAAHGIPPQGSVRRLWWWFTRGEG